MMNDIMEDKRIQEEEKWMKRLRFIVDLTQAILMQANLTLPEACRLVESSKKSALILFPDKEDVYDPIYAPRFGRIIAERFAQGVLGSNRYNDKLFSI